MKGKKRGREGRGTEGRREGAREGTSHTFGKESEDNGGGKKNSVSLT